MDYLREKIPGKTMRGKTPGKKSGTSTSTSTGTSTSTRTSTRTSTSAGMNGHFRRDPDVISRLPDTTIDFLSVFIGFRSSNRVKIIILGESISSI